MSWNTYTSNPIYLFGLLLIQDLCNLLQVLYLEYQTFFDYD